MQKVIDDFGAEWSRFDQRDTPTDELQRMFSEYFEMFPFDKLQGSEGFDLGAGSGRWAKLIAPIAGKLHVIEPSQAIHIAKSNLAEFNNCVFHQTDVEHFTVPACDFGYCLGVLHHVEDTESALQKCIDAIKPGAPFLLYLYYRFDNRPRWFRFIWKVSDVFRRSIAELPSFLKFCIADAVALMVYWPLSRLSRVLKMSNFPLSQYAGRSFYTMRTDALDRFGTRLEKRFTKAEIRTMMENCGLEHIQFSEKVFWVALGYKSN